MGGCHMSQSLIQWCHQNDSKGKTPGHQGQTGRRAYCAAEASFEDRQLMRGRVSVRPASDIGRTVGNYEFRGKQ